MVMHFSYTQSPKQALIDIRNILEEEGFQIKKYAPEDGFIFTDYREYDWGTGRRLLAVTVHVHDKITINGMGKMDIPVSDMGNPDELLKIKSVDRLPYNIQKKIFLSLINPLEKIGLKRINHWP